MTQAHVIEFLFSAEATGGDGVPANPKTHVSWLFLAGEHAYKMMRDVKYPT